MTIGCGSLREYLILLTGSIHLHCPVFCRLLLIVFCIKGWLLLSSVTALLVLYLSRTSLCAWVCVESYFNVSTRLPLQWNGIASQPCYSLLSKVLPTYKYLNYLETFVSFQWDDCRNGSWCKKNLLTKSNYNIYICVHTQTTFEHQCCLVILCTHHM